MALLGTLAGALAARAAWVRAGQALDAGRPGRAVVTWLVGVGVAALLVDVTRAAALTAYAGPPRPLAQTVALGFLRTPGMISVRAVELLLYFALALGELFVLARGLPRLADEPARQALVGALCLAPALTLVAFIFVASRIAQLVVARGLPAAPALASGYDVAQRRLGSVVGLGAFGAMCTAPFWISAPLLPIPLGALAIGVASLWLYAALAALVGSDSRLALG
jgi:hypothetical protein